MRPKCDRHHAPKATPFVRPAGLLGETNAPWSYTPPGGCSFLGNIPEVAVVSGTARTDVWTAGVPLGRYPSAPRLMGKERTNDEQ